MTLRSLVCGSVAALLIALSACSCDDVGATSSMRVGLAREPERIQAQPFAVDLLDLAFEAATDFPIHPHIKTRSRLQEQVVQACLELGLIDRVLPYLERIDNWRRGAGYADYAFELARRGDLENAHKYIGLATQVAADHAADPRNSQWRTDRIRAKVARVYLSLGQEREAAEFSSGLDSSQIGLVHSFRTSSVTDEGYEKHLKGLDELLTVADLERVKAAMTSFLTLFDRYYGDPEKRDALLARIVLPDERVPLTIRLDFLFEAVDIALGHNDAATGLKVLDEIQGVVDAARWLPGDETPIRSRLGSYRFRVGDEAVGRAAIEEALALFDHNESRIVDINRSDALLPVAEAFVAIGDPSEARKTYFRVLGAAFENPNARPRCEDFVALCCSLAVLGIEPDEELVKAIHARRAQLGSPW